MDEKKKLCIGIVVAILASGLISYGLSRGSLRKHKKVSNVINSVVSDGTQYNLEVEERKVADRYSPLDLSELKKNLKIEDNKMEEIKNSKGEIIGNKEYKKSGEIVITNLNKGKIISTETIEKEKDKKYQGKATIEYTDGTKQNYIYKNGVKEGKAEIVFSNGDREEYKYENGVPVGEAVYYFFNGDREEYRYENGKLNGDAKYIYKNGKEEIYKYVNGERK